MFRRFAALMFVMVLGTPLMAAAADDNAPAGTTGTAATARTADAENARLFAALTREEKRPRALTVLYGSYAALQVMDIVSTRRVIGSGVAQEANPLMGSGQSGRLIAIKAAGSVASIYFAEKMWKKNRVGAIVTMAAVNGITAAVVAHNSQLRR